MPLGRRALARAVVVVQGPVWRVAEARHRQLIFTRERRHAARPKRLRARRSADNPPAAALIYKAARHVCTGWPRSCSHNSIQATSALCTRVMLAHSSSR